MVCEREYMNIGPSDYLTSNGTAPQRTSYFPTCPQWYKVLVLANVPVAFRTVFLVVTSTMSTRKFVWCFQRSHYFKNS